MDIGIPNKGAKGTRPLRKMHTSPFTREFFGTKPMYPLPVNPTVMDGEWRW